MQDYKEKLDIKTIGEILEEIVSLDKNNNDSYNEEIEKISNELIMYYENKGRHLYSEVSTFLYEIKEEDLDYIYTNVEKIHEELIDYDKKHDSEFAKKIIKLEDHIRLELLRFENLKKSQEKNALELTKKISIESNKLDENTKEYQSKFKELKSNYSKLKNNIDGLNSQIISVIGIFSAIVITFFGGINFLESVMSSIGKVSKYRFVFAVFLTGFVMFNTIFMLLNFISKLTGKNIRTECKYLNADGNCRGCKIWIFKCVKAKHPTVFWINVLFILGMVLISILYAISCYIRFKYGDNLILI